MESNISLAKVEVADNIDLISVLQEFENYYQIKFGKNPKLVRKVAGGKNVAATPAMTRTRMMRYEESNTSYDGDRFKSVVLADTLRKVGMLSDYFI